jgi:hypothetical protein
MILVKQSVSIVAKYGLKVCLFDDVNQQVVAYFYDDRLADIAAWELNSWELNFSTSFHASSMRRDLIPVSEPSNDLALTK